MSRGPAETNLGDLLAIIHPDIIKTKIGCVFNSW